LLRSEGSWKRPSAKGPSGLCLKNKEKTHSLQDQAALGKRGGRANSQQEKTASTRGTSISVKKKRHPEGE